MGGLEVSEVLLMSADGLFELLDVLGSPLSEGGLSLTVPLLPLFRRCIDRLAPPFPLRLLILLSCGGRGGFSFRARLHGLLTTIVFGWVLLIDRHVL
jgi:hypothetical protein